MPDKRVASYDEALAGLDDGMTVMIGGFGDAGVPFGLVEAVLDTAAHDLTLVCNNAGTGERGIAALLKAGRVRRIVCSYPRSSGSHVFDALYKAGRIELELVPQGTLVERIRCAGAGLGGFYSPVGAGTDLAAGKEVRDIDGRAHVLERPLGADFALIAAARADTWGNLVYARAARNFGPVMATAARVVVAEVREIVAPGTLDPECVVTPGIFVDRVVMAEARS
ncbi:MAG: 3-oxoacid CoA-transferase subunit A [Alphaproteobacteria bacterium]|nr:MAG: 3-oxoacid CoA-transferase subunit A [Alphaproteobacteria bacterium]